MKLRKVVHDQRNDIETLVDEILFNTINTIIIGKITKLDESLNKVTVLPQLKRFYNDENGQRQSQDYESITINLIYQKNFISKIKEGDVGVILISQSDSDYAFGIDTDYDYRRFDLLDGLFIPITHSRIEKNNVVIESDNHIQIKNASNELFSVLKELTETVKTLVIDPQTQMITIPIQQQFDQIITKIESFISSD